MTVSKKTNSSIELGQYNGVSKDINGSESSNDIRNSDEIKPFLREETMRKIKSVAGHVGLLITLMVYTAAGGMVFRQIELPAELARLERLRTKLRTQRYRFLDTISNNTDVTNLRTLVNVKLREYEEAIQETAEAGMLVSFVTEAIEQDDRGLAELPAISTDRWSILQAVFFASTVLTTIGIPLTLTVIADWGKLFAEAVVQLTVIAKSRLSFLTATPCFTMNLAGRRSVGAVAAVALLFVYLACGAGMFMLWEDDWGFFEGFYFCFVTMTTIGFGDLVPKKPKYTLLCTLYILVGLALTSTIIELVRRQYAQSWRRLQALSGPLAETIRRLGEHAGGDMSALHSDLRKVLTVVSMPRLKWSQSDRSDSKEKEWEEAVEAVLRDIAASATTTPPKKPIVQIVVYESSV
uniref:TWiK family of potassium channels protein 7-like isoform X2 n=1 Tax=Vespula vulgaris TaxID=7454 RepID=UPI00223A7B39|nr:TWiK family of potassium channels protein 7-like isoform X2 [Vespula vulgaris]